MLDHVSFGIANLDSALKFYDAVLKPAVDAFYRAAIKAGGTDNGRPGLRPEYHANYYGAFVIDPEGHAIEACCHEPE